MTQQEENLLARLRTLEASSLYEIVVYITPQKTVGFWMVTKTGRTEGEGRGTLVEKGPVAECPKSLSPA